MAKNPASLFYWADWENDQELCACDIAAQGLWMRMLCIAARAREYGFVLIGDQAGTPEVLAPILARTVGRTARQVLTMIHELLRMGAASLDDRGWVYCRRMVRSVELSAKRSAAGKLGAAAVHSANGLPSKDPDNLPSKTPDKPMASSRLQDSGTSKDAAAVGARATDVVAESWPDIESRTEFPGLSGSYGILEAFVADGADIDRDVLPTIRKLNATLVRKNRGPPRSFGYYAQAIADAKMANEQGLPDGNPAPRRPQQPPRYRNGFAEMAASRLHGANRHGPGGQPAMDVPAADADHPEDA